MAYSRIFDIIQHQLQTNPLEVCLARRYDKKNWTTYSTEKVIEIANKISSGLLQLGLKKGDKIAIVSINNRPEWQFLDLACSQIGVITVPIYPTISSADYEYIFNHAEVKYLFVSDKIIHRKLREVAAKITTIQAVYSFEEVDSIASLQSLYGNINQKAIDEVKASIDVHDVATIIYTSGTTGIPKGVMLTHNNIVSNVKDALSIITVTKNAKTLSFLPLCHVFERTINYAYFAAGASIYYADGLETISDNLQDIQPDYFTTVPRLLEKVFEKIVKKGKTLSGFQQKLFFWALNLAESTPLEKEKSYLQNIKFSVADKLIFSKWRLALGNNIKAIICGSAPLQPKLATIFTNAGIPVLEGYGLTECSPIVSVIPLNQNCFRAGCVGRVLPSIEVKLANDGEILVKGPSVMKGYYKDETATNISISKDGWLSTGDIGEFTTDNFLKITDRKKDLFKTSGGKYIAPTPIENKMKESFFIENIALVGDGEKYIAAIIQPNFLELTNWANENHIKHQTNQDLTENLEIKQLFKDIISNFNTHLGKVEQVKDFILVDDEWTVDNELLTPTMKLRRKKIKEFYQKEINLIYNK
ncbi:MAG: long-chain fatty acid--CoA ligase [Chitinophagales bacterium]|nr:long-chain fatty acid--CoA ligase [Chitinophagales bacterium]